MGAPKMIWGTKEGQLLCPQRLVPSATDSESEERSPYQRDYDRIIFSSAFRRLQDKAQVFPLARSDYVRTRLTHSLEAASVGRSLGILIGQHIIEKHNLKEVSENDFGTIVSAACLAHDIGNPPFGHQGEKAIQNYFQRDAFMREENSLLRIDEKFYGDFLRFEGNAQGFRVLTRLVQRKNEGGMRLTSATLASFTKYPKGSSVGVSSSKYIGEKKHGFFEQDRESFETVARNVGLVPRGRNSWCRHPLAFLIEAADDICYNIVDLEDAVSLDIVDAKEAFGLLNDFFKNEKLEEEFEKRTKSEKREIIEYLRAKTINFLVNHAKQRFIDHEEKILRGEFNEPLIEEGRITNLKKTFHEKVLGARNVAGIEAAGFQVLGGLLRFFVPAVVDVLKSQEAEPMHKALLKLVPEHFRSTQKEAYHHIIGITDFVSGMTDSYAVSLYRKITGITISDR